jgi:IS1 family transposase
VRATGVSERWLQYYVNQKLGAVKREVQVTSKKKGQLIIQCDEMWSFVGCEGNKQWIWLAIDVLTKEIVGVYIGKRDESGAIGLWDSIPAVYRQCAVSYTDFWSAYQIVFPKKRHKSVSKDTGKTNYIERFNNTMRQRISRLVRKTLSFSKKLSNHIGSSLVFYS